MGNTAHGLRFLDMGDAANISGGLQDLGQSVDERYGAAVADVAALAGIDTPYNGMQVWVTTPGAIYTYTGTNWIRTTPKLTDTDKVVAPVGPTSGTAELTLSTSATIEFDGNTDVDVEYSFYNITLTVPTDVFLVRLYDGATPLAQWLLNVNTNGGSGNLPASLTPAAGMHTFTAKLVRSSGSGTASLYATVPTPAELRVRQTN